MLVSLAGSAVELTEAGYADNLCFARPQEVSTAHEHCRAGQSIRPTRLRLMLASVRSVLVEHGHECVAWQGTLSLNAAAFGLSQLDGQGIKVTYLSWR